jgi:hypothetical protein
MIINVNWWWVVSHVQSSLDSGWRVMCILLLTVSGEPCIIFTWWWVVSHGTWHITNPAAQDVMPCHWASSAWCWKLLWCLHLHDRAFQEESEDWKITVLRNFGSHSLIDTDTHPRRLISSAMLLWEPYVSHITCLSSHLPSELYVHLPSTESQYLDCVSVLSLHWYFSFWVTFSMSLIFFYLFHIVISIVGA